MTPFKTPSTAGAARCFLRPALLATALTLALPGAQAADAPAAIAWSAAQIQAAGVATRVLKAAPRAAGQDVELQGTVVLPPQASVAVSAPLAGVVQEVYVSPGQSVKAGQAVARLLSPQLLEWQREMLQAQSQSQLARTKRERDEKLFAEGIISELRLQEARSQEQVAQLALAERQQALRLVGADSQLKNLQPSLTITAASAGTLLEVSATPGLRLDAGMPVALLARAGRYAIELQASAEQAARLKAGDRLSVAGCKASAVLASAAPQVNASNQTVQLRADFNSAEGCLRVNQYVRVKVGGSAAAAAPVVMVPAAAVVQQAGQSWVFVRSASGFTPTRVELGAASGDGYPLRQGLADGAEIAVKGIAALKGAWAGLGGGAE